MSGFDLTQDQAILCLKPLSLIGATFVPHKGVLLFNFSDPLLDSTDSNQTAQFLNSLPLPWVRYISIVIKNHFWLRAILNCGFSTAAISTPMQFILDDEWMISRLLSITSCSTVLHWIRSQAHFTLWSISRLGIPRFYKILLSLAISPWGAVAQQALQDRDVELRQCEHSVV